MEVSVGTMEITRIVTIVVNVMSEAGVLLSVHSARAAHAGIIGQECVEAVEGVEVVSDVIVLTTGGSTIDRAMATAHSNWQINHRQNDARRTRPSKCYAERDGVGIRRKQPHLVAKGMALINQITDMIIVEQGLGL